MKNNKKDPIKLWSKLIGNRISTRDIALRKIKIDDYANRETGFGWTIDHIKPISKDGKDALENLMIVHIKTNEEKGSDFPQFKANGKTFEITSRKVKGIKKSNKREYDGWKITEVKPNDINH